MAGYTEYLEDVTVANPYNNAGSSFAYTVNANNNRLFIARFEIWDPAVSVSATSYGGNALTFIGRTVNATQCAVEIWGLVNPPSGSNTFAWTLTATSKHVAAATGFAGINQATSWRNYAGATGNSTGPTVTVTGTTIEHKVLDALAAQENVTGTLTATVGAGQTQHFNTKTTGLPNQGNVLGAGSVEDGGVSSTVMSWTLNSTEQWALAAVEILPILFAEMDMDAISLMTPQGTAKFAGKLAITAAGTFSASGAPIRLGVIRMEATGGFECMPVFPQGDVYLPIAVPQVLFYFRTVSEFKMLWVLQELNRPKRVELGGFERVILRIKGQPDKECTVEDANDGLVRYITSPLEFDVGYWTGKLVMELLTQYDSQLPPGPDTQPVSQQVVVESPEFLIYVAE